MKRTADKSQTSALAMLSAGVFLAAGATATAQAPKAAPPGQKAPAAAPQGFSQPAPMGLQDRVDRGSAHIKFAAKLHKDWGHLSAAGMLDGQPVFKNAQGDYFQVDANTGDLRFHTAESLGFMKIGDIKGERAMAPASTRAATFIKFDYIKIQQRVSLVGVDAQGHVIQETSRGEKFYLGPNGDMVFVK